MWKVSGFGPMPVTEPLLLMYVAWLNVPRGQRAEVGDGIAPAARLDSGSAEFYFGSFVTQMEPVSSLCRNNRLDPRM